MGEGPAVQLTDQRPLVRLVRALRSFGVRSTLQVAARMGRDAAYDVRRGMWTLGRVGLPALTIQSGREHGYHYEPTRARPFLSALRQLGVPTQGRFVDLGCGKGRALVLALEHGFPSVVGVEFAAELVEDARDNLRRWQVRTGQRRPVEVRHMDARQYAFEPQDRVVFLYNPFDEHVLACVLSRLRTSLTDHPRDLWLVYANPVHRALLDSEDALRCVGEVDFPQVEVHQFVGYRAHLAAPTPA